jgi:hypothetical protein
MVAARIPGHTLESEKDMDRREIKRLRQHQRPPPDPTARQEQSRGLIPRLLGFWLFNKLFGGGS